MRHFLGMELVVGVDTFTSLNLNRMLLASSPENSQAKWIMVLGPHVFLPFGNCHIGKAVLSDGSREWNLRLETEETKEAFSETKN